MSETDQSSRNCSIARIRRGRLFDLSRLVELEEASFSPGMRDSPKVIRRSLNSPHQEVWLAEIKAETVGCLLLRCFRRTLRVYSISVDPDCRGTGVGRVLMDWAEDRARARGIRNLVLEANAKNQPLVHWYQKQGYRPVRLMAEYYESGEDAIRMRKKLACPFPPDNT